jgi:hypothetical protein
VLEFAREEAQAVNQTQIDVEHVLLGLLHDPEGVAGLLLRKLGVNPQELRAEVLKTRFSLMKIVERAVRPVRASIVRKRKMREELFAHLTAIYEQELARLGDPNAAVDEAARRFGEPAELADQLQSALPYYERISYFTEKWVLYRAPESVPRYSLRLAGYTSFLLAVILSLVTGGVFLRYGWVDDVQTLARVLGAIVLLTPPAQFVVTIVYVKIRDALWGAFGSRKSFARALLLSVVIAAVAQAYLMGVAAAARWDLGAAVEAARLSGIISLISGIAFVVLAYLSGPSEIRDTQWALLDVETA